MARYARRQLVEARVGAKYTEMRPFVVCSMIIS